MLSESVNNPHRFNTTFFPLSHSFLPLLALSRLVLDFDLLVYAFGQLPLVVSAWLCMFMSALVVPYGLFHLWAGQYQASRHRVLSSVLAGAAFLLYQWLCLGFMPIYVVVKNGFPPASRFIIILEQVTSSAVAGNAVALLVASGYIGAAVLLLLSVHCGYYKYSWLISGNKDFALSVAGSFDNEGTFLCQGECPKGAGICTRKEL